MQSWTEKTLNANASALDRVNVSRLIIYLREQLDDAAFVLFTATMLLLEPISVVARLLDGLVSKEVPDPVVCDDTNNNPARIDRNELHIDVAVHPTLRQ